MEIVELNVGGRRFTTTQDTLCKRADSMLAAMFSGDLTPGHLDSDGRVFIDRNGDLFAIILSYLRGEPLQLPSGLVQRRALAAEAHFFQLIELEQQLFTGSMAFATGESAEQHSSSMQVAELTCTEAYPILIKSAKAAMGPQRVNQICQQLVHAFLFKRNEPCSGAEFYTRVKAPEELKPLNIATSDNSSRCMHVKFPGLDDCELECMLKDYRLLFTFKMRKRGYSLEHTQADDEKSPKIAQGYH